MALRTTAARRPVACLNCHQWVLRSFLASIASLSAPPSPSTPHHPLHQRRTFSRSFGRSNEARERMLDDDHALNDINDIHHVVSSPSQPAPPQTSQPPPAEPASTPPSPPTGSPDVQHVPWYLQSSLQPQQPLDSPLGARQRLPDLPDHPPPLLQPLLAHLSVELGFDDLNLLDLRTLRNPPPALGPNTLMLLGSARSEKHLHVSADRLCRWLRSDPHFLSPFPDGLLGRKELKLKIRRKAKRSRLMAGSGGVSGGDGEVEEGVRTGWVCVNVGRVEGGELPEMKQAEVGAEVQGFVGFSTVDQGGCRIVVQMMTEEKREEVGLERLWEGILRRHRKDTAELAGDGEVSARISDAVESEGGEDTASSDAVTVEDGAEESAMAERVNEVLDPASIERSVGTVQRDLDGSAAHNVQPDERGAAEDYSRLATDPIPTDGSTHRTAGAST